MGKHLDILNEKNTVKNSNNIYTLEIIVRFKLPVDGMDRAMKKLLMKKEKRAGGLDPVSGKGFNIRQGYILSILEMRRRKTVGPQHAKRLPMPDVLSKMGFSPVYSKKGGDELWYRSPFRNEKTPSFHITYIRKDNIWVWKDFGGGKGSNLLEFVMQYRNETVGQALKYLRGLFPDHSNQQALFTFHQPGQVAQSFNARNEPEATTLELIKAIPIQHPAIIQYLEEVRKIPKKLFSQYLKEVHYWNTTKNKGFFAFGMRNESDGYEIRSASDQYVFKSALLKRDITVIPGRAGDIKTVNIFEGMLDFLSLLSLLKTDHLNGDAIIMHSTSSFERTKQYLQKKSYSTIFTFLDNDESGRKYTEAFKSKFGDQVINQSHSFKNFPDLNEVQKAGISLKFSPTV